MLYCLACNDTLTFAASNIRDHLDNAVFPRDMGNQASMIFQNLFLLHGLQKSINEVRHGWFPSVAKPPDDGSQAAKAPSSTNSLRLRYSIAIKIFKMS